MDGAAAMQAVNEKRFALAVESLLEPVQGDRERA
jgi:hypothetical protein